MAVLSMKQGSCVEPIQIFPICTYFVDTPDNVFLFSVGQLGDMQKDRIIKHSFPNSDILGIAF